MSQRAEEQEAVYTTIVGGRPPGCGTKVGNVPRGIEILVKKASVDPSFKTRLLADRSAAADDIGLKLESAEAMMLNAIPVEQLSVIIDQIVVPEQQKSAFLGKLATTMLLALSIALPSCDSKGPPCTGIRPEDAPREIPAEQDENEEIEIDEEETVDKPSQAPEKPDRIQMTKGSRPDNPKY